MIRRARKRLATRSGRRQLSMVAGIVLILVCIASVLPLAAAVVIGVLLVLYGIEVPA